MKVLNVLVRLLSVFALLAYPYIAQGFTNPCIEGDTTEVFYLNGVWNTRFEANHSLFLLKQAYQRDLEAKYPGQHFVFRLAYNRHEGLMRDIIETIGQKRNEINDPEVHQWTAAEYLILYMTVRRFVAWVPVPAQPIATTIEGYLAARMTAIQDASAFIQMARTSLLEGKRELWFAHSQGNMFAGQVVATLMGEYPRSIGMIGLASPAAAAYNNSPYFTAHDDRVINALRLVQNVLPSNIDNDLGVFNDSRDSTNHQFEASYFAVGLPSRPETDRVFYAYMENLEFPTSQANDGIITVTLTWGAQPDVDLHTYEPNGLHVYYSNRQGRSGYLDLDDTTSYGPEHYYVSCSTLEAGTYRIGVNYFSGYGPETALVQVKAGLSVRSFTIDLAAARGGSGDFSPVSVADIIVSGDATMGYGFDVRSAYD